MSNLNGGLAAYYTFNGNADDVSGNNHNGALYGATLTADRFGNAESAYNFSGSSDRLLLDTPIPLEGEWTIAAWFKMPLADMASWNTLTRGQERDHQIIINKSDNNHLGCYDQYAGFKGSGYRMNDLTSGWHHIAAVAENGQTSFYIDGKIVGSANFQSQAGVYAIGNYQGGGQSFGTIDDLRIYNRAISEEEINTMATLVLDLPLDEIGPNGTTRDKSGGVYNVYGYPETVSDDLLRACVNFDGVDDFVNLGNPPALQVTGDQTIEMWINPSVSGIRLNPYDKSYNGEGAITYWSTGKMNYFFRPSDDCRPTGDITTYWVLGTQSVIPVGQWTHIAAVRDFQSHKLLWYVNGVKDAERDIPEAYTAANPTGSSAYIGSGYAGKFQGRIARFKMHSRALSEAEIRRIMLRDQFAPVLKLSLGELANDGSLTDESFNNHPCVIQGDPVIVPDDLLGSCMSFDGTDDCVDCGKGVLDGNGDFAISVWVKWIQPETPSRCVIIQQRDSEGYDGEYALEVQSDGSVRIWTYDSDYRWDAISSEKLNSGAWHHIAAVQTGDGGRLYIDGAEAGSGAAGKATINPDLTTYIGADGRGNDLFFNGQIANVRIYTRALSEAEIRRTMLDDQNAEASFKTAYPLDFKLMDDEELNVLYISDGESLNSLNAEIENASDMNIEIDKIDGATEASVDAHHFELKFKSKTFEDAKIARAGQTLDADNPATYWQHIKRATPAEEDDWTASDAALHADGKVSIYFLYTGDAACVLNPGATLSFILEYKSAGGAGGARGTNVQLLYKKLKYENDSAPIQGTRLKSADIINQRGKKGVPLHVSIVGSNAILNDADTGASNDGSASSLKICVINTLKEDKLLFNTGNINTERNTKFTILFDNPADSEFFAPSSPVDADSDPFAHILLGASPSDTQDQAASPVELDDLALASVDQLKAIEVNAWQLSIDENDAKEIHRCDKQSNLLGSSPIFEITPALDSLNPGEFIQINLDNIHSHAASGFANIYIKYEDIPGYWDGMFMVQAEKSPIAHREVETGKRNVGIGVAPDADNRLKVSGRVQIKDGSDVSPSGGGYLALGDTSGLNIAMDDNEIMARNNGAASTLHLNADGGDVVFGIRATVRAKVGAVSTWNGDISVSSGQNGKIVTGFPAETGTYLATLCSRDTNPNWYSVYLLVSSEGVKAAHMLHSPTHLAFKFVGNDLYINNASGYNLPLRWSVVRMA